MIESLSCILPAHVLAPIRERLNYERLYEIRLRVNRPVAVNYGAKLYYLTDKGLSTDAVCALMADDVMVRDVILRATEFSLYAANDQLRQGFLTVRGGVRIGIAGEIVNGAESVKTVKNFGSVNIRIPHEVRGAADCIYRHCCMDELRNTLIISPPGAGKTTVLRDLALQLGNRNPPVNVLMVDERNELAASYYGKAQLNVGGHTDIIANSDKAYAFGAGIRALAPDVIITDELAGVQDAAAVEYAVASGVYVIASCHASNHLDILQKPGFETLVKHGAFVRYVNLSKRFGPGSVEGIFDRNFTQVYAP